MAAQRLFAVTRKRGPAWDGARPMEDQPGWRAHADFMNGLHAEGLIIAGGPLEGTSEVLFAMRADSADEIASRLAEDPWVLDGHLELVRIAPWTLRLGSLG